MGFQDSWWNIFISRLAILAASCFGISCRKKNRQTDKQTDRQTNAGENHFPATEVGLGKNAVNTQKYTALPKFHP